MPCQRRNSPGVIHKPMKSRCNFAMAHVVSKAPRDASRQRAAQSIGSRYENGGLDLARQLGQLTRHGMTITTIEAEPVPQSIDLDKAALIIIDMQRDFLEPGG